jgi:hypothetical protein
MVNRGFHSPSKLHKLRELDLEGAPTDMKKLALAIALCLTFVAHSADAKKKGGVTMPDSKTIAGKKVVLNGMGIREATVFNVDVYVAGLYLESKSKDYKAIINSKQVKQIHLKFVRDVDRSDITDAWKKSFRKNSGKNYKDIKAHVAKLNSWMSKIKEGQTLTFTVVPGKGTTINVNGKDKGTINDVYFGRVMVSVFIGKAPNSGLKKGLLGR